MTGRGYVEALPSGKFRARWPRSMGMGRKSKTFATEAEANDYLDASVELAEAIKTPAGTLRSYREEILRRREHAGLAAARSDPSRWKHVLASDLADMALSSIKPQHVAALARKLSVTPSQRPGPGGVRVDGPILSRQSQTHVLNLLRVVLAAAVIDGKISTNPALGDWC